MLLTKRLDWRLQKSPSITMIPALMWNNGEVSQDISRFPKEACTFLLLEKNQKRKMGVKAGGCCPETFCHG
jgi:hypothetical protein